MRGYALIVLAEDEMEGGKSVPVALKCHSKRFSPSIGHRAQSSSHGRVKVTSPGVLHISTGAKLGLRGRLGPERRSAAASGFILCFCSSPFSRDIAKNSLLRWPSFIYWTILGVYDAVVMFFGAYFLFDNTSFTSNGQVPEPSGGQRFVSSHSFAPSVVFALRAPCSSPGFLLEMFL